jgi:hypothetical protein
MAGILANCRQGKHSLKLWKAFEKVHLSMILASVEMSRLHLFCVILV